MTSAGAQGLPDSAFRKILDSFGLPVLVMAADGTITYAGGTTERDFGRPGESVVGRNVLDYLHPDDVEEAIATMADLAEHERIGIGVPTVYSIVRHDGSITRHAIGAVPMTNDPDVDGVVLWFTPWDAQLSLDQSLASLLAGDPLDEVLEGLARAVAMSLEAVGASVHHGWNGESFDKVTAWNVPEACLVEDRAPWDRAVAEGKPTFVAADMLAGEGARAAQGAGIEGLWALPIPGDDAVLTVWRPVHADPVTAHDFVIRRCLQYVQLTLVRYAEHEQLAHMANHDPLTGSANRLRFREHLELALVNGGPAVLLYCDMDRFKHVNDTLGHDVGDAVLVEVVARLRTVLRPGDELARMGGDEFTILLRGDTETAETVARRLIEVTARPFEVAGERIELGLSVGIAEARPGDTADSLLRRADAALYEAKRDPDSAYRHAR